MAETVTPSGHLQVVGARGKRKWRAFWHDAEGKQTKTLGPAWVKASTRKSARGATIWYAADGSCPAGHLTPDMARDELARILADAPRQKVTAPAGTPRTFMEAAERWYDRAVARGRKPSTLNNYRQILDCYLLPFDGDGRSERRRAMAPRAPFSRTPLRDLTRQQINSYFASFPNGATKEKLVTVARAILRNAYNQGWLREPLGLAIERDVAEYTERDSYTVEQLDRLLLAAEAGPARTFPVKGGAKGERQRRDRTDAEAMVDLRDATMYATAGMAGLRLGELLALRWRDIDVDAALIAVERNFAGGELVSPKGRSRRHVPIQPALAERLLRWRDRTPYAANEDLVFPADAGSYQDRSAVRRRYVAAAARAGLPHKPFHSLRHHFATRALAAVNDLGKVRDWAGHQDIRTTGGYVRTQPELRDAAALAQGWSRDPLETLIPDAA